jgi:hypothetical protein
MNYLPQRTIKYKTYIKTAVVQAFRDVFKNHIDALLQSTRATIDFPRVNADFPTVLVRFYERDISNMGVGHIEHIEVDGADGESKETGHFAFKHYLYHADLEFAIFALTSKDRDLISDSVVQILGMGQLEEYTNRFFERIYPIEGQEKYPDSIWHYININTDQIKGFGETQEATPWASEDDLIYKTSYRTSVMGEFYSVPPDVPLAWVEKVGLYPYIGVLEEPPTVPGVNPEGWEPPLEPEEEE